MSAGDASMQPPAEPNDIETERLARLSANVDRARLAFLANVGHALATPMHALLGNLELIDTDGWAPENAAHFAAVRASAVALERYVDGLLQLVESEAQPFEAAMQDHSLEEFADAVEADWQRRLASNGQLLFIDVVGPRHAIRADWLRLHQVADRLLDNVVRHAAPGRVHAQLELRDGVLILVVADSGPGIDEPHRDEVLQPFVVLDASPGSAKSGVGIGLAVASRLLTSVGGTLRVEAQGGGTAVIATMPVERRAADR